MSGDVCFETFTENGPAEVARHVLVDGGVPAVIETAALESGFVAYVVRVPEFLLHRARWLRAESALSEAELSYIATGKLSG